MVENKYKVGDVVQMKSGGPNMTVGGIMTADEEYYCQWIARSRSVGSMIFDT
jgi:uncharacterized protein YodC (DUF2158 family)